ncbi:unnamed protein product [Nippostrongylus brasiliensis]|uniref:tRNA (guanine(26)-N(2))-dimethyltransferase n=1 Tax=Nippostrongylus brasiliensis TaxID=27835 RepID=A0A0N4YG89_NIPBR|nr:unnamed protein product [Nippostrongylus brasiliensis]
MGEAQQAASASGDAKEFVIVQEGKAKVGFHGPVFYNPVQEFNRDLTVSVLREFVENVDFVLANDFSENAVESIKENIVLNGVEAKVRANFGDAIVTMMEHRSIDKRFHAVDLDPYGSASVFLDSAVQCVADQGSHDLLILRFTSLDIWLFSSFSSFFSFFLLVIPPLSFGGRCLGILMVTCTDMAVLCGNTPETCYNKYGSTTVRLKCCHEMALRILLRSIDAQANRYTRYIEPLLSISVDFYVRVFVRLHTGARKCKDSGTKVANVLACSGCHSLEVSPLLRKIEDGKSLKYSTSIVRQTLMGADNKCVHCGHPVHQAGPIYVGPMHNRQFVEGILNRLKETHEEERLGTHNRLLGVLTNVSEELDVPLYYEHDQLFNVVKCSVPKSVAVKSAILNAGYKVSGSHCNPRALKTDAPTHFLWDICRFAAKQANIPPERHDEKAPGRKILSEPIKSEINFQLHPGATLQTKNDQMVRFQCNKGKNWGPRAKAKGSINSTNAGFYVREQSTEISSEKA